jgi:hypothetical protein
MTKQIFAFWRIAINRHDDGISAVFGGSVHSYEARIVRAVPYWKGFDENIVNAINLELTKRERNNW